MSIDDPRCRFLTFEIGVPRETEIFHSVDVYSDQREALFRIGATVGQPVRPWPGTGPRRPFQRSFQARQRSTFDPADRPRR